ncbi:MAG: glycosyltransferase family 4 protein [Deferrisomatales bacterium]|nr:glycosyltransferase family 4 protein [Deferrisomatales bacterium]
MQEKLLFIDSCSANFVGCLSHFEQVDLSSEEIVKENRQVVLIMASYFLPGTKAGGPLRSLANLVELLKDEFDFRVLTRNTDLGEVVEYAGITPNTWLSLGGFRVMYLRREDRKLSRIGHVIREVDPDVIYFNSLFDPVFTIGPLALFRWRRLGRKRSVILAPRGELAEGALALKSLKKRSFLALAGFANLYRGVLWQASGEHERAQIQARFGSGARVDLVPNFRADLVDTFAHGFPKKRPGFLRMVLVGRIARNKNIFGAISILKNISQAMVSLTVFGPLEDQVYWAECEAEIARLPPNVTVEYGGILGPEEVVPNLSRYDLFFLPTAGENFGHAILEALVSGCPVLISDRTPWRGLADRGVGWDLPLQDETRFLAVVKDCAAMDQRRLLAMREKAMEYGRSVAMDKGSIDAARRLFRDAVVP